METIPLHKALTQFLGVSTSPVITDYELGKVIYSLYRKRSYKGQKIRLSKDLPDQEDYKSAVKKLLASGILSEHTGFSLGRVYKILSPKEASNQEIICAIDPFAYISHFSAMEYHGLTDKVVKTIFYSTLPQKEWRQAAKDKLSKELEDTGEYNLPHLVYLSPKKLGKNLVYCFRTKTAGSYQNVVDSNLRVAKIGRVFLDMLQKPDLCGGIYHVLEIYRDHANRYLDSIIAVVNNHGKDVDKVRVGYVLEERCAITDKRIDEWKRFAQRGGSRKLDSSRPYANDFSSTWSLSLNIED